MLLTKNIEVAITARNIAYYKDKGYNVHAVDGQTIIVDVIDISPSSHIKIKYLCDCCGNEYTTEYANWNKRKHKELGDMCHSCARKIKQPMSMLEKYGYENSANVPSIIEKKKRTNMERYGVEWSIASSEVAQHIKATMLEKYGVENAMQNEDIKDKAINTMLTKDVDEIKTIASKRELTCLHKYGVRNPFQNKEIQEKARNTLCKNGNVPSSKAEKKMCQILCDIFGNERCFSNYPVGNLSLDCLVEIGNDKIDFEYDGAYWHKDRAKNDGARNAVLMNEGYKIVRIKADNKDTMPSVEQIKQAVDYLVKDNHHITFIDMNK